jgi:1-deoxy-D-xylulose-5-phosphate reductoisomerase
LHAAGERRLVLLGATGTIGRHTLDVVRRRGDVRVVAVAARRDVDGVLSVVREHRPAAVALEDAAAAEALGRALAGSGVRVLAGADGIVEAAAWPDADVVLNGIVGAAGLAPTLAALAAGRTLALANKESLVTAGALVMRAATEAGATIVPVDSEHSALFQCLRGREPVEIREIVLTASGGPFRGMAPAEVDRLPPSEALRHPTWRMGERITVDSATLMNKGLEVIEAHWLFGLPPDRIRVVIHPQSIVHAMAILSDGSAIAHLSRPDMRLPIEAALTHPHAPKSAFPTLDLAGVGRLEFERPDLEAFPCLAIARRALERGGTAPAVLNAADEVVVRAYLDGTIPFSAIPAIISETLDAHDAKPADSLAAVRAADAWARDEARRRTAARASRSRARRTAPATEA